MVWNAIVAVCLGYDSMAGRPLQKGLGTILSWIRPIREMVELNVLAVGGPPRGRLLDVGSGSGQFLYEMRELGWEVFGVEPDRQAVKMAREQFGLSVYEGTLEEAGLPDNSFDAITMNHVIEHVLDPIGILQECRRVLKSGGSLVVVTPNVASLGHLIFRQSWRGLEVPRHFSLFLPRGLQTCTERAGLRVVKLRTVVRHARQMWARSYLIRRNRLVPGDHLAKKGFWLRLGGLAFQAVEEGLCQVMDAGEEILLTATKEDR